MFNNYLKIAIRSLWRHRFFSAINIFGLAVAMSIGMGIIMLVADQVGYDRYNSKRDRIYRIVTTRVNSDGSDGQRNASASMALRSELLEKYTGIEKVVRLRYGFGNHWLEFEDQDVNIPLAGFYADPEVFDFFEYEFQYGDPASALKEPYSVVLTRKAANKLFKEENPIGLTIKVGKIGTYTVTGVLKETSKKSHIVFEALASMATIESLKGESNSEVIDFTNNFNHWTYILPVSGTSPIDIQQHLDKIFQEHIAPIANPDIQKMKFGLQPMSEITLGPLINNTIGPMLPLGFVYLLSALALIILLTSCFNFTNLSIARSLTRAREIGVRKVTGAARWQIFVQFLTESVLVAMVALVIGFVLLLLTRPLLLQLNFARIFRWGLESNFAVCGIFVLFALVVGILAGLFPAIVLSGFQPVKVLKSMNNLKVFSGMGIRKVLLVSQFTLSLFFILSVIIMQNQLRLFINKDHGFNMESNVMVKLNSTAPQALKTELLKYSNIQTVTAASHVAASGPSNINGFKKTLDEKDWTVLNYFMVDEDYLKNMELKLVAGKFYTAEQETSNKDYIVINEEAVKELQYESPVDAVGEEIISQSDSTRKTIIGVVVNYNHRALFQTISPLALMYNPSQFNLMQVRYSGSYENAVESIEKAWATVNPGLKIDYNKVKSEINRFYEIVFGDIVRILGIVSFLAILISCLGLLGMATYTTETRMKEISIRKVLGSDSKSLVLLLSKGFLGVLALAIAIGVPAAYLVNNLWLELIAYHTSISLLIIAQGVLILLLFGVLTVGSQTIRVTFINPVNNLKID
jgi:putative ABC transport system permease protein